MRRVTVTLASVALLATTAITPAFATTSENGSEDRLVVASMRDDSRSAQGSLCQFTNDRLPHCKKPAWLKWLEDHLG